MNDLLQGVNLYLIGMMGSGKTTIGQRLAKQLNYRFLDTDAVVEEVAGRSINDIFATDGEAAFRQLETQVLAELAAYTRLTIATGGGIVLQRENWSYLHHGVIVWLDVPVDHLYTRLQRDTSRPLLRDANPQEKLRQLLQERQALYRQADVHVAIAPHSSPEQVTNQVINEITKAIQSSKDG